ncbi:MAG: polysaccharide biosynthesis/export family protein [Phreatobacter sp.]|uniref:polysaccharide biosynthesis/export family protein n=1 Tax=Phreatobacter sp. TaxID=1966341 RepID=UPI001A37FC10|nr:polysaccharide biosynthesis/export family protein [Phreatobacter sp.]MBL8568666.1 polysaccharide biosynthesis/export family protein [Phreatobacter sp.]
MTRSRHSLLLAASLICIGLAATPRPARADGPYRLAPGDTVEIGLAVLGDQRQRAMIQADGTIALPWTGRVMIGGLTAAEFQARMEALLPNRVLRSRTPDGREHIISVRPEDIFVSVAEFRPVYVTGDVLTPGQQTYRPQMTVRQVVTAAGGYSLLRSRATQTGADPADLRRDHDTLWTEYTREYYRILRTRAELAGHDSFDLAPPRSSPLPASVPESIGQAELESLKVAQADFRLEGAYLARATRETQEQAVVLARREQEEEKGVEADTAELERINRLYGGGNLVSQRVSESRRAVLMSSSRRLETTVQLMRARRQADDYARQLERLGNQRQNTLLLQLRDASTRLADLALRIQAVGEKLRPSGGAVSAPGPGATTATSLVVTRKIGEQWQRLPVTEDTDVLPGDVVEAVLRSEATAAVAN